MGKQTSIWIMSVLFGLGIFAAYHSDNQHAIRSKAVQAEYRGIDAAVVLEKSNDLLAKKSAQAAIEVQSVTLVQAM